MNQYLIYSVFCTLVIHSCVVIWRQVFELVAQRRNRSQWPAERQGMFDFLEEVNKRSADSSVDLLVTHFKARFEQGRSVDPALVGDMIAADTLEFCGRNCLTLVPAAVPQKT